MNKLNNLPQGIVTDWLGELRPAKEDSAYRLIEARRTTPATYEEGRIIVLVVDENGFPLPGVKVMFGYSTAHSFEISDFVWMPPFPHRADIFPTNGGGQIEHIQNHPVKRGEPGGITVCLLDPSRASDVVTGMGMLADHTGIHLTFQRQDVGAMSLTDRINQLEDRLSKLENQNGL